MRRRAIAGVGAAAIGVATAVAALVVGTSLSHAASTTSSAYGLAAEGPIPIEPTPTVESNDGQTHTSTQLELPDNPLISLRAATVSAGDNTASVELLDLGLGGGEVPPGLQDVLDQLAEGLAPMCEQEPLPEQLPEEVGGLIPEEVGDALDPAQLCESLQDPPALLRVGLVKVFCEGNTGGVQVAEVSLFGQVIPIPPAEPNTVIIPPNALVSITANKQTENEDGTFNVKGVEINLGDGEEIITLGSATCGPFEEPTEPPAPSPTPVTTPLPVTG